MYRKVEGAIARVKGWNICQFFFRIFVFLILGAKFVAHPVDFLAP